MSSPHLRQILLGLFLASAGAGVASILLVEALVLLGRARGGEQGSTGLTTWPTRRPGAFLAARIACSALGAGIALYLAFKAR